MDGDSESLLIIALLLPKNSLVDLLFIIRIYHMILHLYVNKDNEASFWLLWSNLSPQIKIHLLRDLGIHLALENRKIALDLCNEIYLNPDLRDQILKIYNYSQNGNIKDKLYDFVSCLDLYSKDFYDLWNSSEQGCMIYLKCIIDRLNDKYGFNIDDFLERYQMRRNSMGFCFKSSS